MSDSNFAIIDIVRNIFNVLVILGGISTGIYFIRDAIKFEGQYSARVIIKYSAVFGMLPALVAGLSEMTRSRPITFYDFQLIFELLVFSIPIVILIFLHWTFYRFVALKAEQAGRSFIAFLVLSIFFPFVTLVVVLVLKPNSQYGVQIPVIQVPSSSSLDEQLSNLNKLRLDGVLSEEEFTLAKNKLIS